MLFQRKVSLLALNIGTRLIYDRLNTWFILLSFLFFMPVKERETNPIDKKALRRILTVSYIKKKC